MRVDSLVIFVQRSPFIRIDYRQQSVDRVSVANRWGGGEAARTMARSRVPSDLVATRGRSSPWISQAMYSPRRPSATRSSSRLQSIPPDAIRAPGTRMQLRICPPVQRKDIAECISRTIDTPPKFHSLPLSKVHEQICSLISQRQREREHPETEKKKSKKDVFL